MATYFHGASEIQPEGLQTLYLMNPGYVGYSDSAGSPPENMVFLNSGINHPMSLSNSPLYGGPPPPPPQHFVGIPLQSPAENSAGRFHYNIWSPSPPQSQSFGRATHQQGLSLSLSSHQTPPYGYRPEDIAASADEISPSAPPPAGLQMQSVLMNSKYLKAARELLDEMASVSNGGGAEPPKQDGEKSPAKYRKETVLNGQDESCGKRQTEPTAGEKQDLQMKKAKLHGMLDEVEQRYRQYNHQMRIVVSSFEAVAGHGSAKTYTSLALQTISKQFRCLRDTISGQIRAVGKSLGEEDRAAEGEGKSMGTRLRLVDHQLRQQRALQQLGMMQPNGWRPQRGLPERAVSILRAWLFEHFLHPYPKDSDKLLLAKQTGLTRSQVSNWFINARVRLWKPMVEEMYVEEIKDQEKNNNHAEKRSYSDINDDSTSKASSQTKTDHPPNFTSMKNNNTPNNPNPSKHAISETQDEETQIQPFYKNSTAPAMKSPEISSREILMKFHGGSFDAYAVEDSIDQHFAPRFHGNGVSLTLGLPHCESMSFAGSEPAYLSGEGIGAGNTNQQASSHVTNSYGRIEIQNRKRFAAQLLPDFVA